MSNYIRLQNHKKVRVGKYIFTQNFYQNGYNEKSPVLEFVIQLPGKLIYDQLPGKFHWILGNDQINGVLLDVLR